MHGCLMCKMPKSSIQKNMKMFQSKDCIDAVCLEVWSNGSYRCFIQEDVWSQVRFDCLHRRSIKIESQKCDLINCIDVWFKKVAEKFSSNSCPCITFRWP